MVWLLLVVLCSTASLEAQKKRPAPPKPKAQPAIEASKSWPIEAISVEGNRGFTREQVIAASGLKIGETVDPPAIEAARERLFRTGAFGSVAYQYGPTPGGKGYRVVLEIAEIAQNYPYRFEEIDAPAAEIEAHLRAREPLFGARLVGTDQSLGRYTRAIEEHLAAKGRAEKIVARLAPSESGQLEIVFRPARAPAAVAQVKFTGNSAAPTSLLANTLAAVAVGVQYNEPRMRQLLDANIRPLYDARGRVRVSFPGLKVERATDVDGVVVTIDVSEGEVFNLGSVAIEGVTEDFVQEGRFKTGEAVNFDEVETGVERIRKRLRAGGYTRVQTKIRRAVDDQKKLVDLTIEVEPGPQYHFGKLHLEGLDLHTEPVVRRLWALKEGQPFNQDYPDFFLDRIRQDGLFDNLGKTRAAIQVDEKTRRVDVTLRFEGAPPAKPERPPR